MTSGNLPTCETRWSSVQRPVFSPGLLLEDVDLNLAITYTQALMRLMLRSMFGCGVVCGLKVSVVPTCKDTKRRIDLTAGVAVDGEGNLIEVSEPWQYEFGPDCDEGYPPALWVLVCYTEQCCRPKDVACGLDDEGGSKHTRVRSGYKIKVLNQPPKCGCRCATPGDVDEGEDDDSTGCCGGSRRRRQRAQLVEDAGPGGADTGPTTTAVDPCACYTDHFNGVCACECSCRCVVLGKIVDPQTIISKDKDGHPVTPFIQVDATVVRKVRPVLNGYLECLLEKTRRTVGNTDETMTEPGMREATADREAGGTEPVDEDTEHLSKAAARVLADYDKRNKAQKLEKTRGKTEKDKGSTDNS